MKKLTVTGHTGCIQTKANSLESIIVAARNGANIVEFDLNFSSDGKPVLSHDAPKGGEVTLDEAFATVKKFDFLQANVDVKSTAFLEKIPDLAKKHNLCGRYFYTGLFEKDVDAVKTKSPDVPYYLNIKVRKWQTKRYIGSLVKKVKACGAVGINFHYKNATQKLIDTFRENGLLVSVWTVDDEAAMKKALVLSPDNITTRYPDKLIKLFAEKIDKI